MARKDQAEGADLDEIRSAGAEPRIEIEIVRRNRRGFLGRDGRRRRGCGGIGRGEREGFGAGLALLGGQRFLALDGEDGAGSGADQGINEVMGDEPLAKHRFDQRRLRAFVGVERESETRGGGRDGHALFLGERPGPGDERRQIKKRVGAGGWRLEGGEAGGGGAPAAQLALHRG